METDKIMIFESFARKAAEQIEKKKQAKQETLHIGCMDMDIQIRGLSDKEFNECIEAFEDAIEVDKYTIYCASYTLQEAAKIMVMQGLLPAGKEYKITDCFSSADRREIVKEIMDLSGLNEESSVEVIREVEEIKN